jgi:hypothetical protein
MDAIARVRRAIPAGKHRLKLYFCSQEKRMDFAKSSYTDEDFSEKSVEIIYFLGERQ